MKLLMRRVVWLALLTLAMPLAAVVFTPLSIEQLAAQSQLILQGTVFSKTCQRDGTGRIYTSVELQVSEVWKGRISTNRFLIVHGGGTLGRERLTVSGQVDFQIGEEVVAFLVINPRGEGVSLGLAQGKFHVWQDRATGQKFADNPFHGVPPNATSADKIQVQGFSPSGQLTLGQLKQRVLVGIQ